MVEETLQGEMGGGATGLIDRGGLGEPVDGAELEQLGTGLEVPGPARGESLERRKLQFDGHAAECKTGL
jgi:hypothetical protein